MECPSDVSTRHGCHMVTGEAAISTGSLRRYLHFLAESATAHGSRQRCILSVKIGWSYANFEKLCTLYRQNRLSCAYDLTWQTERDKHTTNMNEVLQKLTNVTEVKNLKSLVSPTVLTWQRPNGNIKLHKNLWDLQIGCELTQERTEGGKKLWVCLSWLLKAAQKNYDTTHKECLAVIWAVKLYLECARFSIQTPHHANKNS